MGKNQRPMCAKCRNNMAEISYAAKDDCRISFVPLCRVCFSSMREGFRDDSREVAEWLRDVMERNSVSYDDIEYITKGRVGGITSLSTNRNKLFEKLPSFVRSSVNNSEIEEELDILIDPEHVFSVYVLSGRCRNCGVMLDKFIRQDMQGCSFCFYEFREEISQYIGILQEKRNNISRKKSKVAATPTTEDILLKLERDKEEAVYHRDYKLAAQIRDEIRSIKAGLKDGEAQ